MGTQKDLYAKKLDLAKLKALKKDIKSLNNIIESIVENLPIIDDYIKNIESTIYTEFLWYNKKEKVEVGRRLAVCESPRHQHILYYEDLGREQAGRDGFINTNHLLYTDTDGIQALYDTVKEYNKGI
jgi:hypothetical protein